MVQTDSRLVQFLWPWSVEKCQKALISGKEDLRCSVLLLPSGYAIFWGDSFLEGKVTLPQNSFPWIYMRLTVEENQFLY